MASLTQWTRVSENSSSEGQGSLVCCSPWDHKDPDTTERLNNNKARRYVRLEQGQQEEEMKSER